jgi:hypothetical protein
MSEDLLFRVVLAACLAVMDLPPASAQNVVTNGNFATDTAGWTPATGAAAGSSASVGHTLADGSPTAGAATLGGVQNGTGGTSATLTQCVSLAGVPLPWTLGGRTRLASFEAFGTCSAFSSIRALLYPTTDCTGSAVVVTAMSQGTVPGVAGPFTLYVAHVTSDPNLAAGGTRSATITLYGSIGCINDGGAGGSVNFDTLYFGYIPDIFAHGFETQ